MSRQERKAAARAALAARVVDVAQHRADRAFGEGLGPAPSYYSGRTPPTIDGVPTLRGKGGGGCGRMRYGMVERTRGGGLRLRPLPNDPGAPKRGGAHMSPGHRLTDDGRFVVAPDGRGIDRELHPDEQPEYGGPAKAD